MQFLKTLFWVVLAVFLAVLSTRNWHDVEFKLWGDIIVNIKLPILLLLMFLIGFLPTFLIYRARLWTLRRRLETLEKQRAFVPVSAEPTAEELPIP